MAGYLADELGLRLKMARLRAGLEQAQVAERLGTHRVQVSKWERGVNRPEPTTLKRLAELYRTTVAELSGGGDAVLGEAPPAYARDANLPRQLRLMALDFEREALKAGADEPFMRYVRNSFADPDFVALFGGGPDESPMTAEEAIDDMKAHIAELRSILKTRLKRAREKSGKLAPRGDDDA